MQRIFKWVGILLAGGVVLVTAAAAYVYAASEYALRRQYDIPLTPFTTPTDAESIARGKRVAILSGCYSGCHGKTLEGNPALHDLPNVARIATPNVSRKLREYSDAELVRLLRHGLKRDGTTTWIMPVPMFSQLSERDIGDLVAFLRSEPVRDGPGGELELLPLGRLGIVLGKLQPVVAQVNHARPHLAVADRSDALEYGKYLVNTTCTECHGQSLEGSEFINAPNLAIVQAYSEEDFFRLMRTGRGLGDRQLGLMSEVAEVRFTLLTDEEVRAVRNYLLHRLQADPALAAAR
jgi:cytochrome c553